MATTTSSRATVVTKRPLKVAARPLPPGPPPGSSAAAEASRLAEARERRIHEDLLREQGRQTSGAAKLLIPAALGGAFWISESMQLTGPQMLVIAVALIPTVALGAFIAKKCSAVMPAFSESMAGMVIVATMVGIGGFAQFFMDGTLSAAYRNGHPPTATDARPAR